MRISLLRRHRRKLLFPPGLLALAGLLWLGCFQLSGNPRLKRYSVLQLTMMPLRKPATDTDVVRLWISPKDLNAMRRWQVFHLHGLLTDSSKVRQIVRRVPALRNATDSTGGIKVVFGQHSKYADFIRVLDAVDAANVRQYAFDVRVYPPVFYAFENKKNNYPYLFCGTRYIPMLEPLGFSFDNWVTSFWKFTWLKPLAQPEWRPSMYLLVAISVLSSWRMVRNRHLV